jgi:hypothetical protein
MMYAINRQLEYFDMPQVRRVVRDAKKDDYTLPSLVLGVVNTDAFRKQGPAVVSSVPKPAAPVTTAALTTAHAGQVGNLRPIGNRPPR